MPSLQKKSAGYNLDHEKLSENRQLLVAGFLSSISIAYYVHSGDYISVKMSCQSRFTIGSGFTISEILRYTALIVETVFYKIGWPTHC